MGWWDEGIMGGDTPLDFKGNFEDTFGSPDAEFNQYRIEDGHEPIPFVKPAPQDVVAFIKDNSQKWGDDEILRQVAGFLLMERGAPMNAELRQLIIEGIDMEVGEGAESWGSPETRLERLEEFRKAVLAYPDDGAEVTMPESPGLFSKMGIVLGGE
jgi:hypothetical protein